MFYPEPGTVMYPRPTFESVARLQDLTTLPHCRFNKLKDTDRECRDHWHADVLIRIPNRGGYSAMDVHNPEVTHPQVSSNGQNWYLTEEREGYKLQTVEAGWIKLAGERWPILFAMMTPDNYTHWISGVYDPRSPKKKGFWQRDGTRFPLEQALKPGYRYRFGWQLRDGAPPSGAGGGWWLTVEGDDVGHFPLEYFNGGPMTRGADAARFGGETVCNKLIANLRPIETMFPKMGSGVSPIKPFLNLSEVASHDDIKLHASGSQVPLYERREENNYRVAVGWNGKLTVYYGGPGGRY
jgi:hypothetical protein